MIKEKISSQEIIDQIAAKAAVSKRAAEEFLKVMIATIEDALMAGEAVKIKGFGTFKLQWNEPRKSVNVSTGEEIILDGYYKVAFAPEASLKEIVNEPFSHLEPVQLEGDDFLMPEIHDDVALDPLRIFTEQATEIKDLLSEIQALSPVKKEENTADYFDLTEVGDASAFEEKLSVDTDLTEVIEVIDIVEEPVEVDESVDVEDKTDELSTVFEQEVFSTLEYLPIVPDEFVVDSDKENEPDSAFADVNLPISEIVVSAELDQKAERQAGVEAVSEYFAREEPVYSGSEVAGDKESVVSYDLNAGNKQEVEEMETSPFLMGVKATKKSKKWWWISAVFILLVGVGGLYVYSPPVNDLGNKLWNSTKTELASLRGKVSIGGMLDGISNWFQPKPKEMIKLPETVVIPKDTSAVDTVVLAKEPIDTLQQLFDQKRDYEVYIASEQIKEGSRLTLMSEKYYGSKDFWVYIYEANIDRIKNPDKIEMGTLIRIPKLDPRLIDASNPRCIEKARELHDKYVKKKL